MEFGDCGSLADSMNKEPGFFSEQEIQYILASVLLGIAYLHSHKKIHRVEIPSRRDFVGHKSREYSGNQRRKSQNRRLWSFRQARHDPIEEKHGNRHSLLDGSRNHPGNFLRRKSPYFCHF